MQFPLGNLAFGARLNTFPVKGKKRPSSHIYLLISLGSGLSSNLPLI